IHAGLRQAAQTGGVRIMGAVRNGGLRSLSEAPTLREVIGDGQSFADYPYLLFGVVETTDGRTQSRIFKPFSPERVLYGEENMTLRNRDKVILLSRQDVQFLSSSETRRVVLTGQYTPPKPAR